VRSAGVVASPAARSALSRSRGSSRCGWIVLHVVKNSLDYSSSLRKVEFVYGSGVRETATLDVGALSPRARDILFKELPTSSLDMLPSLLADELSKKWPYVRITETGADLERAQACDDHVGR
jgi:hypothetical protein